MQHHQKEVPIHLGAPAHTASCPLLRSSRGQSWAAPVLLITAGLYGWGAEKGRPALRHRDSEEGSGRELRDTESQLRLLVQGCRSAGGGTVTACVVLAGDATMVSDCKPPKGKTQGDCSVRHSPSSGEEMPESLP